MENRRREARVVVESGQGTLTITSPVEVVNMSLGGAAFRTRARLQIGSEYDIRLDVAGNTLTVRGAVAWSVLSAFDQKGGDSVPVYAVGMKFRNMFAEGAEDLITFIDEHKIVKESRLAGVRFHVDGHAFIDHSEDYRVRVLSSSGMLLETDRPLRPEEVFPVRLTVGPAEGIAVRGRVASCTERLDASPKHYDVGIEFLDLDAEQHALLERAVQSLSTPGSGAPS